MTGDAPYLESLTRRLAECPSEFLLDPAQVNVGAVVYDTMADLGFAPDAAMLKEFTNPLLGAKTELNRLQLIMVACWLLHHEWFLNSQGHGSLAFGFLRGLGEMASLMPAQEYILDEDRREEFVRTCLYALKVVPAGESEAQAIDRLTTLSSIERQRVLKDSHASSERARAIREAMARKASEEAAASYGRE